MQALACGTLVSGDIKNVVGNLEGKAKGLRIVPQRSWIGPRHQRSCRGGPSDQRPCLAVLQGDDLIQRQRCFSGLGGNIQSLPQHHTLRSRRLCHGQHKIGAHSRIGVAVRAGQTFESQCLQSIARQNGCSLVPCHMHCGAPPAQVVIIHTGQIIMDKAIGVDHLDRRRRPYRMVRVHPVEPGAFHDQKGAQTFTPLTGIAHGIRNLTLQRGHDGIQMRLHLCCHLIQSGAEHLQTFDRLHAHRLAVAIKCDRGDLLLGFLELGLAALLQFRTTLIEFDGLFQRHVATFKLADHGLQLLHRLFEAHLGYGPFGHAILALSACQDHSDAPGPVQPRSMASGPMIAVDRQWACQHLRVMHHLTPKARQDPTAATAAQQYLAALLAADPVLAGSAAAELLRLVPGRRAILSGQFNGQPAVFRLSLHPEETKAFATAWQELTRAHSHMSDGTHRTVTPLALAAEGQVMVLEQAPGTPLLDLLWSLEPEVRTRQMQPAAIWLRRYTAPTEAMTPINRGPWRNWAEAALAKQTHVPLIAVETQVFQKMKHLSRQLRDYTDWRTAICHGDFHPNNLIVAGDRLTGIDLGGSNRTPIYRDMARFLTHMARRGMVPSGQRRFGVDAVAFDAFVNAFDLSPAEATLHLPYLICYETLVRVEHPDMPAARIRHGVALAETLLEDLRQVV